MIESHLHEDLNGWHCKWQCSVIGSIFLSDSAVPLASVELLPIRTSVRYDLKDSGPTKFNKKQHG